MFDVIECFHSSSPNKPVRLIVFQSPDADLAQNRANQLRQNNITNFGGVSTFIVIDRSTERELYRVPKS